MTTQQSPPSPSCASPDPDLPTYQDVLHASQTLQNIAHRTPIHTSRTLDAQLGVRVFFKCENLQRMGAFKFRGAYTAVKHYLDNDGDNDNDTSGNRKNIRVLTYSSGNHAQAIALAATSLLGVPSTIIMPRDAPPLKIEATRSYGGDIVFYDRYTEERDAVAERVKKELSQSNADPPKVVFVPPYDHKYVIAGQGTVGKEFLEDLTRFRPHHPHAPSNSPSDSTFAEHITLDYLFVCVGGGGLLSGVSLASRALSPRTQLIGVEPLAGNDAQQSLRSDRIVKIATPNTIADGAQTQHLGELTFRILRREVERIVTVTDEELVEEMRFFGERMKMVVEPTGCLGLAGLRKMVERGEVEKGSCCGVVISGGNVDLERYCRLISKC